jgi:hypothetical protein
MMNIRTLYLALVALAALTSSHAMAQTADSASPFAPIATPTIDADALKPPPPDASARAPRIDRPGSEPSGVKLPNSIDLGDKALKLEAGVGGPNTRKALDSGESSNLSSQRKDTAPGYLGLKLTAPTR